MEIYESKEEGKDQESIESSTIPDLIETPYEKVTKHKETSHTRFSPVI